MSRYTITESVGSHVESVHRYEDLAKHHPSSGREAGRDYAMIDGRLEEVRQVGGRTFVKKDMIFAVDNGGPVDIPAPANGYVHYLHDGTNAVRLYDRPFGAPGATLLAQVLHMRPGSSPPEGSRVDYGAPLGRMGDTGTPGSIHAHIEMEPDAFRRYIADIERGAITPDRHPSGPTRAPTPPEGDAIADGVLRRGEQGAPVRSLQARLNALGVHDAQGRTIRVDGDFGPRTEEAVRSFQRARGLGVDGVAGRETFAALGRAAQPASPTPAAAADAAYGPTPLSNLIGRGEGGYGSFNRGRAGDAGNASLDFARMTIGEVMRRQSLPAGDSERLFAVGKFQMIPGTLREAVEQLRIDRNARFTPDLQERMFAEYLVADKRPAVRAYITGPGGPQALAGAQLALAQEFASVADPRTGRGYYDGDSAGNLASISARETQQALDRMRELYRANVARGMDPAQAYAAIGGGAPARHPQPTPRAPTQAVPLQPGDHGDGVRQLQRLLLERGATDAARRAVVVDGDFGARTEQAIRRFQRGHGLHEDGVAGPETWRALREPPRHVDAASPEPAPATVIAPVVEMPQPDAVLMRQAMAAMTRLEAGLGRTPDVHTDRAAELLVAAARREGLASIDHVLLGEGGRRLFAVQGDVGSPMSRMAFVDTERVAHPAQEQPRPIAAVVAMPDALGERAPAPTRTLPM